MYAIVLTKLQKISFFYKFRLLTRVLPKRTILHLTHNTVIVSQSHDIYTNLALEDWLYQNYDFTSKNISLLLMWYNGPCVVIGRHQNPWLECSVGFCESNGISVARRNSGGGTVYHDFGNLNCSFMTAKGEHNRKRNLEFICESIRRKWPINLSVSKRDDILCENEYKEGVQSKATSSTRSKVKNLKLFNPELDVLNVIKAISEHYRLVYQMYDEDVLCLNPNEESCPGINTIKNHLTSWDWKFGHTPEFSITKSFNLPFQEPSPINIKISVIKGRFGSVCFTPQILDEEDFNLLKQSISSLPFSYEISKSLEKWVELCKNKILCSFIKKCLLQMVLKLIS